MIPSKYKPEDTGRCADCDGSLGYHRPEHRVGEGLSYCGHCFNRRRGRVLRPAPGIVARWAGPIGGLCWSGIQRSEPAAWFRKDASLSADLFCRAGILS